MSDSGDYDIDTILGVSHLSLSIERYHSLLLEEVPDSTFYSHQSSLSKFRDWLFATGECDMRLTDCFIRFSQYLLKNERLSVPTVHGHLCTLVNLLAFHTNESPDILKCHVVCSLVNHPDASLQYLGERIVSDVGSNADPVLSSKISSLVTNLRQSQFGSRTHLYIELLLDTRSRPEQVRQLDLADIDIKKKQTVIGISETYLVSLVGLLTERVSTLSEDTLNALETYLEYEREKTASDGRRPLLTTHNGRASASTLRRSVKQASAAGAPQSVDQSQPVVPDDVWQYALSKIISQQ